MAHLRVQRVFLSGSLNPMQANELKKHFFLPDCTLITTFVWDRGIPNLSSEQAGTVRLALSETTDEEQFPNDTRYSKVSNSNDYNIPTTFRDEEASELKKYREFLNQNQLDFTVLYGTLIAGTFKAYRYGSVSQKWNVLSEVSGQTRLNRYCRFKAYKQINRLGVSTEIVADTFRSHVRKHVAKLSAYILLYLVRSFDSRDYKHPNVDMVTLNMAQRDLRTLECRTPRIPLDQIVSRNILPKSSYKAYSEKSNPWLDGQPACASQYYGEEVQVNLFRC
ncbi:hypothetical protein K440DRAFT_681555 [Wilcoxina mikolae CBS 423.85]|nr:hypothetical protein K440DRAFT_681555 [Wilcoxina mikolae CBS 423.85]